MIRAHDDFSTNSPQFEANRDTDSSGNACSQCFPHGQKIRTIDRKDMNRRSANGRSANKDGPVPLEVSIPLVRAWMKKSNKLSRVWICSRYVWTFVPVAVQAGESEVLKNTKPSMLARNDVILVKRQRIDGTRHLAILASLLGASTDLPDNIPVHAPWGLRGFLRASRAFDCMTARKFPICR